MPCGTHACPIVIRSSSCCYCPPTCLLVRSSSWYAVQLVRTYASLCMYNRPSGETYGRRHRSTMGHQYSGTSGSTEVQCPIGKAVISGRGTASQQRIGPQGGGGAAAHQRIGPQGGGGQQLTSTEAHRGGGGASSSPAHRLVCQTCARPLAVAGLCISGRSIWSLWHAEGGAIAHMHHRQ